MSNTVHNRNGDIDMTTDNSNETRITFTPPMPNAIADALQATLATVLQRSSGWSIGHYPLEAGLTKLSVATVSTDQKVAVDLLIGAATLPISDDAAASSDGWDSLPIATEGVAPCNCRQTRKGFCLPGCASLR